MRQILLHRNGEIWENRDTAPDSGERGDSLLIFFCGWASDHNTVRVLLDNDALAQYADSDILVCWDYSSPGFKREFAELASGYSRISVVAWSLGVWAAQQDETLLALSKEGKIVSCTAVNGTVSPVDDRFGIPVAIFKGTLDGLNDRNLYKFRYRMCGGKECYMTFMSREPERSIESDRGELGHIFRAAAAGTKACGPLWTTAVIGTDDAIFPSSNQRAAWEKRAVEQGGSLTIKEIAAPHFGIGLFMTEGEAGTPE